jgi:hypothetical protein
MVVGVMLGVTAGVSVVADVELGWGVSVLCSCLVAGEVGESGGGIVGEGMVVLVGRGEELKILSNGMLSHAAALTEMPKIASRVSLVIVFLSVESVIIFKQGLDEVVSI